MRCACFGPAIGLFRGVVFCEQSSVCNRSQAAPPLPLPALQAQALQLSKPKPTGCDAEMVLRGVDVVPLTSDEQALRQLQQVLQDKMTGYCGGT